MSEDTGPVRMLSAKCALGNSGPESESFLSVDEPDVDRDRDWDAAREECEWLKSVERRPHGYKETNGCGRYIQAVLMSLVSVAPVYAILDDLSHLQPQHFVECNGRPCHYLQIFKTQGKHGTFVPGSGADFIQVRNGMSRPISILDVELKAYTVGYGNSTPVYKHFPDNHTQAAVDSENDRMGEVLIVTHYSYLLSKLAFRFLQGALSIVAAHTQLWGMEQVVPAVCDKYTEKTMKDTCKADSVKENIFNHMTGGILVPIIYISLAGWALLKMVHDILLMWGTSESITLLIGGVSIIFQGCVVAGTFFWSMGASSVFVANVPDETGCLCYYQMEPARALVALNTPFALLVTFLSKQLAWGRSCVFGDFVYCATYNVPHYLVSQSMLSSWGTLVTPRIAGTFQTTRSRERIEEATYLKMVQLHSTLGYFRCLLLYLFVPLAACPFVVRVIELLLQQLQREKSPMVGAFIRWGVLPLPSEMTVVVAIWCIVAQWHWCFDETFDNKLELNLPECVWTEESSKRFPKLLNFLPWGAFIVHAVFTIAFSFAVAQGLLPNREVMFSRKSPQPSAAQAELWGAFGFMFFGITVRLCLSFTFPTDNEWEALNHLAGEMHHINARYKRRAAGSHNSRRRYMRRAISMSSESSESAASA